jgi:DNA-binding response OmpR family regulator
MSAPEQVSVRQHVWQTSTDDGLTRLSAASDRQRRWTPRNQAHNSLQALVGAGSTETLERLTVALLHAGHEVGTARDGQQAFERWQLEQPDLVVLEAALPQLDGLEVCRRIREYSHGPIVVLVASAEDEETIVRGLELGADEVLPSSYSTRTLVAHMQTVARRASRELVRPDPTRLHVGDLVVDLQMHQVIRAGEVIRLTRLEFRLLCLLMGTVGQVVPYARLVHDAWGYADDPTPHLLKAHMSRLRRKLSLEREGSVWIEAILGIGYRLAISPHCPIGTDISEPGRSMPGHQLYAASRPTPDVPGLRGEPVRSALPGRLGADRWTAADNRLRA